MEEKYSRKVSPQPLMHTAGQCSLRRWVTSEKNNLIADKYYIAHQKVELEEKKRSPLGHLEIV